MTQATKQLRDRARKVKLPLKEAAARLGVTRQHLSLVLHGHRESRRLVADFRALLETIDRAR